LRTVGAIRVESLSKLYHSGGTEVIVFDDLSLEVSRGEQLAIVGESGAGKSTLMHLLGGLDRPSGGRIYYGEREIVSLSEKDLANFRNREIGFVWQNPSLLPEFTAAENVMMPLLIRGVTPELAQATAGERLREVGLWNRRTHRAGELSGGERQRVGLARALITGPGVLLADEPTGNLDFRTGELILDLLGNLHAAHALTSVIVTHNPGLASRCDRVLELKKGALHTLSVMELQEAGVVVQDATRLDGGTYV
jgi:lipoprotein-releasing system ATP-binding protein